MFIFVQDCDGKNDIQCAHGVVSISSLLLLWKVSSSNDLTLNQCWYWHFDLSIWPNLLFANFSSHAGSLAYTKEITNVLGNFFCFCVSKSAELLVLFTFILSLLLCWGVSPSHFGRELVYLSCHQSCMNQKHIHP